MLGQDLHDSLEDGVGALATDRGDWQHRHSGGEGGAPVLESA